MQKAGRKRRTREPLRAQSKESPVAPSATLLTILFGHRGQETVGRRAEQRQQRNNPQIFEQEKWSLEFEQVHAFDVERLPVARNQNDDAETHGGFRGRHHDHEEDKDLAVELPTAWLKGHKRQIHGVQHQLDGHENRDDVALKNERHDAETEEYGAQS